MTFIYSLRSLPCIYIFFGYYMFMILIVFKMIIEEVSDQMLYLHLPNIIIKDEKDMPNDLTLY